VTKSQTKSKQRIADHGEVFTAEREVPNIHNGSTFVSNRKLNDHHVFIRYGEALPIIDKVQSIETSFYGKRVSSQKLFGLRTYVKPTNSGDITLRYGGGTGKFKRADVTSGTVPVQGFSESWSDEKLYKKYNIGEDEITFIESMIRSMELGGGEDE
jgi:site-specific DNA-methyltransferase (adenine-specific)